MTPVMITTEGIRKCLVSLEEKKAAGLDDIGSSADDVCYLRFFLPTSLL